MVRAFSFGMFTFKRISQLIFVKLDLLHTTTPQWDVAMKPSLAIFIMLMVRRLDFRYTRFYPGQRRIME